MGDELKHSEKLTAVENFAISGVAAIVSKTAAAPIERIKLLVQNQSEMLKSGRLDREYSGVVDCIVRTYKSEGVYQFWRGNTANCIRYFPTQALNFSLKAKIKEYLEPKKTDPFVKRLGLNITAGGIAGSLSLLVVYSLDYARTRLANDTKEAKKGTGQRQFNGLLDVYKKTLASDGVAGLYRGFCISTVGIFIYRGLYFGLYDSFKDYVPMHINGAFFTFTYTVTVVSGIISYPIDTVRRRMMMTSGEAVKYKNSMDCFLQVVRNEGVGSLMKGVSANVLRGVAGAGVLYGFEKMQKFYIATFRN